MRAEVERFEEGMSVELTIDGTRGFHETRSVRRRPHGAAALTADHNVFNGLREPNTCVLVGAWVGLEPDEGVRLDGKSSRLCPSNEFFVMTDVVEEDAVRIVFENSIHCLEPKRCSGEEDVNVMFRCNKVKVVHRGFHLVDGDPVRDVGKDEIEGFGVEVSFTDFFHLALVDVLRGFQSEDLVKCERSVDVFRRDVRDVIEDVVDSLRPRLRQRDG